ncbi:MAG: hypothetical protein ACD_23C00256G0001 [uncultured bacterium]|nr:MAG: hypothetical protein ACD_23C00256G0001 [uncultured bacterium]
MHVLCADVLQQRLVALLAFFQRHLQSALHGFGRARGVVGIHQQGFPHLLCGPGKARQHQHAGVFGVLRDDELLGHQVHAVAQGRHQRHAGRTVQAGKTLARHAAVDVTHGHPVEFAEVAIDRPAETFQLLAQ